MIIKLLTEVRNGRENSSAKRDKYGGQINLRPVDGYLQLVDYKRHFNVIQLPRHTHVIK